MIGVYSFGVFFSYIGLFFGFLSLYSSSVFQIKYAVLFLMLSGIVDIFDGRVAGRVKRMEEEQRFGVEIDSILDTINFGIVPVSIFLHMEFTQIWDYGVAFLYLCAVTMRLAYFNSFMAGNMEKNDKYEVYIGFPVTTIVLLVPLLYVLYQLLEWKWIIEIGFLAAIIMFMGKFRVKRYKSMFFNAGLILIGLVMLFCVLII